MEILNILYNNNLIAVYLIGAILLIILIFIVISSINTTEKEPDKILKDPTDNEEIHTNEIIETKSDIEQVLVKENQINEIVDDIYNSTNEEIDLKDENKDLNTILQDFKVPETVIEDVTKDEEEPVIQPIVEPEGNSSENIENMLKRLYDLRQHEKEEKKRALLCEIMDLKKELDQAIKSNECDYEIEHDAEYNKALADYYLFNQDIEFPKLR